MKMEMPLRWLKPVLVLGFVCSLAFTAAAQNYYPAEIGNTWVLERSDAEERRTYSLEGPETVNGTEVITLKIETEELSTGDLDTDKYFLTVGSEAIKLHGTVFEEAAIGGTVTADFPTPATFFPLHLSLGDKWQIVADAKVKTDFLTMDGKSTTNLEVVGFEDLETPAGTFQNCAKVKLALTFSTDGLIKINLESTTYQWLAPDIGPVQYQNSDGLRSLLISTNLPTEPEVPDTPEEGASDTMEADVTSEPPPEEDTTPEPPPEEDTTPEVSPYDVNADGVVNTLDLTFVAARLGEMDPEADVTGDGIVNILDLVSIAQNFSS